MIVPIADDKVVDFAQETYTATYIEHIWIYTITL